MHLEGVKVTTEVLIRAAVLFALFDTVLVAYLARFIESRLFHQLKWPVTMISGIFWLLVWLIMVSIFWEPVYHFVFPSWSRWIIPPGMGVLFALAGLFIWWAAIKLPGSPVISFCLLGGLLGVMTHIWAIYRGILDKPPLLQGANPVAASIMPFFEFVFYWCIILGVAFLWKKRKKST